MNVLKRTVNYVVRQVLALAVGCLVAAGTLIGALLCGVILSAFLLVLGLAAAIMIALGPILGLTAVNVLEQATKGLERAAADLRQQAGNVTPLKR